MSNIGSYKNTPFSESQKFLVLDPATGSTSLVLGSSLIDYITPRLNSVTAETTRLSAENTDYEVGTLIQTSGATAVGDGLASVYLVVEGGTGDFPMINGNDLLVITGDDDLRGQLISTAAGEGASLVSMEGGPTVEAAVTNRVIRAASIAEVESVGASDDFQVFLSGTKAGLFEFDPSDLSTEVTADTQQWKYIAPDSDPTGASGAWIRQSQPDIDPVFFGAVGDGVANDTAAFDYLENYFSNEVINLYGRTYLIDAIPTGNKYVNGSFDVGGVISEAQGLAIPRKVELSGLEPERLSSTVLRIFPGFCSDGGLNPSEYIELNSSYDIDRTTSGLGGVDNGTYDPNVDYFVYMLKNPTTGDVGAVLSQEISVSSVTKPAGYTLIRKLPWGYISIGGGIPSFHLSYWPLPFTRYTDAEEAAQWRVLSLGTSTTFTTFDLSGLVPDNARMVYLMCRVDRTSSGGRAWLRTTGAQDTGVGAGAVPDVIGAQTYTYLHIRVTSLRELSYRVDDSGLRLSVYVMGYSQTERT